MFLHDWEDSGFNGMLAAFHANDIEPDSAEIATIAANDEWKDVEVLLASYTHEEYEGAAFVLFRRGQKLYEVVANHCSCYGLEGMWAPEETSSDALNHRLVEGRLGLSERGCNVFAGELRGVLNKITEE